MYRLRALWGFGCVRMRIRELATMQFFLTILEDLVPAYHF